MKTGPSLIFSLGPLYPLVPIEPEGAYVESLTSYIQRLAQKHSILVGDLVQSALATDKCAADIRTLFAESSRINGYDSVAIEWIARVAGGTGVGGLDRLTLSGLYPEFTFGQDVSSSARWCPQCFSSRRSSGQPVYSPLLWSFKFVKVCPVHTTLLETKCPHCRRSAKPLEPASRPGFCPKCHRWLGQFMPAEIGVADSAALWTAEATSMLLEATSRLQASKLSRKLVQELLNSAGRLRSHRRLGAIVRSCFSIGMTLQDFEYELEHC